MTLDCWPKTFDGGPDALAALKNLTSELVGRFCVAAQDATLLSRPAGATAPLRRYACDFVVPRRQRLECALLKGVAARYVMAREGAAAHQARERELIAELAAIAQIGAPRTLDPLFRPAWESAPSDPARRRVVIDQLASLTDTSAIAWHHRLTSTPS
jgi:dGTPase